MTTESSRIIECSRLHSDRRLLRAKHHRALALLVLAALYGCSPIYSFRVPEASNLNLTGIRARLRTVLESQGFKPEAPQGFILGCNEDAPDRAKFGMSWWDTGYPPSYHMIGVAECVSNGTWYFYVGSSWNADREAEKLRDKLSTEFADEIKSGRMHVRTFYRIVLE